MPAKRKATTSLEPTESELEFPHSQSLPNSQRNQNSKSNSQVSTDSRFKRLRTSIARTLSLVSSHTPPVANPFDPDSNAAQEFQELKSPTRNASPELVYDNRELEYELFLTRLNFMWHKQHGLLTCVTCNIAVEHAHARRHYQDHASDGPKQAISAPPNEKFQEVFEYYDAPPEPTFVIPIAPIPGLIVTTRKRCLGQTQDGTICHAIPGCDRSLSNYFAKFHCKNKCKTDEVFCHQIFAYRGVSSFVHVDPSLAHPPPSSAYSAYMLRVSERPISTNNIFRMQAVESKKSGFMYASKWDHALDGVDLDELVSQVSSPTEDEPRLVYLKEGVSTYVYSIAEKLPSLNTLYLRRLATSTQGYASHLLLFICWSNCPYSAIESAPFRAPQHTKYLDECSAFMTDFLSSAIRAYEDADSSWPITLTSEQEKCLVALIDALQAKSSTFSAIHHTAWSLFSITHPEVHTNRWICPVLRHIIAINVNSDGTLVQVKKITPTVAKMQYIMRIVAVGESVTHASEYELDILGYVLSHLSRFILLTRFVS